MKKTIKKKWVAALRSGKYKKTKTFLKCDGAFCALGVLVDCALVNKKNIKWKNNKVGTDALQYIFKSASGNSTIVENWTCGIPEEILKKIGLTIDEEERIYKFNDGGGKSFAFIADYIEENF